MCSSDLSHLPCRCRHHLRVRPRRFTARKFTPPPARDSPTAEPSIPLLAGLPGNLGVPGDDANTAPASHARKVFVDLPVGHGLRRQGAYDSLLEEEFESAKGDDELVMILGSLAALFVQNDKPRRGGSAPGRCKSKARQRLEGYCILYADYFADAPVHGEAVFRR